MDDNTIDNLKKFISFFEINLELIIHYKHKGRTWLKIDFYELTKFDPDLADLLLEKPEETLELAQKALKSVEPNYEMIIRFFNISQTQERSPWEIRGEDITKFISLKGILNKISPITHICTKIKFECPSCGKVVEIAQEGEEIKEPHMCACGRRGKFKILNQDFIDVIRLGIIDDLMEEKNKSLGIAKEKIVLLTKDLTHQLIDKELKVGKKVRINGFFKYTQKKTRAGGSSLEFTSVFIANSIEFIKVGWDIVKIEESDKEEIIKLSNDKLILDRLANCIADVEGHDIIKKACILLLTGAPHIYDSNFHLNSRGTIHMLMIGDPGTGKTYMAKRAGAISPINYFQSAANASGKGLVASVNQDKELGIWVAYPGVVPMANQGVVIIDEIDKTSEEDYGDHNNAMNDMEVFIAKSNVKAKLTTETSYLATANPANRVFTDHELFYNQIDMPKDFMDRFDLIFPMVSPTDADKKDKIMDSILDRYIDNKDVDKKWKPEFTHEFITKYISYCRREKPLPTLSKDFLPYIKKRLHTLMKPKGEDQIKVSFRQLESILRFAYASARLHLRDVAQGDIDFAFELKYSSFLGLHIINESGDFDWAKLENIEVQKISDKNTIIDILKEMLSDSEKVVDIQEIMAKCINSGIKDETLVEEIIEKKKQAGDYYEPRRGFLRRI